MCSLNAYYYDSSTVLYRLLSLQKSIENESYHVSPKTLKPIKIVIFKQCLEIQNSTILLTKDIKIGFIKPANWP